MNLRDQLAKIIRGVQDVDLAVDLVISLVRMADAAEASARRSQAISAGWQKRREQQMGNRKTVGDELTTSQMSSSELTTIHHSSPPLNNPPSNTSQESDPPKAPQGGRFGETFDAEDCEPEPQATAPAYPAEFEKLWAGVGRGPGNKFPAFKAWKRAGKPTAEVLIAAWGAWQQTDGWKRGYVPHVSKWIRARGWEDEPTARGSPAAQQGELAALLGQIEQQAVERYGR